jgi:hypothetical protein
MDRRAIIKGGSADTEDVKLRLNCMVIWDSEFVEVQDVGFRDCWLAAFAAYRSSHVALRNSVIEGSTYALAAIGGEQSAGTAHSFEVIGNLWKQSPSAYIPRNSSCHIQSDWNCPVSVWSQLPWGVTHHFFWGALNGALFGSKDIAGNVKISGTRSPMFRGSPAPPITSYNNAVQFTGCGKDDPRPCRQDPDPDPSCTGEEFWTTDRQAIVADCFPLRDSKGKPIPHRMRHNAYNRAPDERLDSVETERVTDPVRFTETAIAQPVNKLAVEAIFVVPENSSLAKAGCALRYADGDVECTGKPGPVGALLADGRRFDLALPFSFPFTEIAKEAQK